MCVCRSRARREQKMTCNCIFNVVGSCFEAMQKCKAQVCHCLRQKKFYIQQNAYSYKWNPANYHSTSTFFSRGDSPDQLLLRYRDASIHVLFVAYLIAIFHFSLSQPYPLLPLSSSCKRNRKHPLLLLMWHTWQLKVKNNVNFSRRFSRSWCAQRKTRILHWKVFSNCGMMDHRPEW